MPSYVRPGYSAKSTHHRLIRALSLTSLVVLYKDGKKRVIAGFKMAYGLREFDVDLLQHGFLCTVTLAHLYFFFDDSRPPLRPCTTSLKRRKLICHLVRTGPEGRSLHCVSKWGRMHWRHPEKEINKLIVCTHLFRAVTSQEGCMRYLRAKDLETDACSSHTAAEFEFFAYALDFAFLACNVFMPSYSV